MTIYHFMSIQMTDVTCIWRCLLCFLTWLCHLYGCHYGLLFLFSACLHIVICQPTICAMFVNFPYITSCFYYYYIFDTLWYWQCIPCFYIVIISSHNIVASICYCHVDRFIPEVAILSYDYKPILNIVVRKLSMVGTCKPWTSF